MRSRAAATTATTSGDGIVVRDEENAAEEAAGKASSSSLEIARSRDSSFTPTRVMLLCAAIFIGLVLSSPKSPAAAPTLTTAQRVRESVESAYQAHTIAKETYLETYRKAYSELLFNSFAAADAVVDDIDDNTGTEEELAKTFTVGVFSSHMNPQSCVTLKSAVLNGLDVHLLGFNASGRKSSGQIDRCGTYKDWYCSLPTNRLTAGGAAFESILQEDATAKNFIRRWRSRNEDIEKRGDFKNDPSSFDSFDYTFSATDTVWPYRLENLYPEQSGNAYKGGGYMDEEVMKNSTTRAVSTGAWMGKSQSLCKLFTKMKQIRDETVETAKQMPVRVFPLLAHEFFFGFSFSV